MRDQIAMQEPRRTGISAVALLLLAELGAIGVSYKHAIPFDCRSVWPNALCASASGLMVSAYTLAAALVVLAAVAPEARRLVLSEARLRRRPLALNLAGLAAMLMPLPFLREGTPGVPLEFVLGFWAAGVVLGGLGAAWIVARPAVWGRLATLLGWRLAAVAVAGLAAPILAVEARAFWRDSALSDMTFAAVVWILDWIGYAVETDPAQKVIGTDDFLISVAPACSGVEGMGLVAVFVTLYLALFHRDLRFPVVLLLYPVGIAASWFLNVLRIVLLLILGIEGQPELAIGGFHSHAGWLMFTLLSLGLIALSQSLSLFRRAGLETKRETLPVLADPGVAQILPFIVFMASSLVASTFVAESSTAYPWRAAAMAVVLALFWPYLRALRWRLDPVAAVAGVSVAALWIALAPTNYSPPPYGAATGLALATWIAARVTATTLFVPVIEELFFRGYLLGLLAPDGLHGPRWRSVLAVVVTTTLFAALHSRWLEAGLAGVVFGALALRQRGVTDAILAHAVANGLIAAWALGTGNWAMI